jgi:hypothetical protein
MDTLHDSINLGISAGECLNKELIKVLKLEESKCKKVGINKKQVVGFLK